MYNSLLYGYGLSLSLFDSISQKQPISDINKFLNDFTKSNSPLYIQFKKIFCLENIDQHVFNRCLNKLRKNLKEIKFKGFEIWVSKNLFNGKNDSEFNLFVYLIYNFWYEYLCEIFENSDFIKNILMRYSSIISNTITNHELIYTTNYERYFDNLLKINHLHGRFINNLENPENIVLYVDGKNVEYKYLFGCNGYEKLMRLAKINKISNDDYDLDFFSNQNIDLGNLLIFGMSFGQSQIMSKEFLKKHKEHNNFYIVKSVDGHILNRLNQKYEMGKLTSVTISYYSLSKLNYLKKLFLSTEFNNIVKFKHSNNVMNFAT